MFNLLGSIFGYGQSSPSVATESQQSTCSNNNNTSNEEASQSTSGLVVASTTPTVNQSTQTQQTKVVDLTNSVAGATTNSQALSSNLNSSTTSPPADWVIVDRSEAAVEKCNKAAVDASTSMTASAMIDDLQKSTTVAPAPAVIAPVAATITNNITDSVMLGSFFDKNAAEDEEFNKKYGNAAAMHQTKDWLITPLPCLTSITASQRSIVDNDPMENLLIEHPSMSVFVAATSSAEDNDDDETATLENEDEEMNVEEEKKPALREVEKNVVMVKSVSEKRKALGSPKIDSNKPPGKRHQKHKKNKKSSAASPNTSSVSPASSSSTINSSTNTGNKENLTVLLPNDYKKQSASQAQSLVHALLLNTNQMKRANKNSVFKNTSANNVKHRKYHKLQQPFQQSSRPVF